MNKELQKKLKKYSAAAVAVAATGVTANGQVVYNQVNKTVDANNPIDSIDINSDGNYDFAMVMYYSGSNAIVLGGPLNSQGHAMAGSTPSSYNYPFKLNSGDQINTQVFLPANTAGTFTFVYGGTNPYNEFWNGGVTDGYLGLKLSVSGNTHYGWVRMDIAANGQTIVIKDMAYNQTANGAIQAGEGLSIEDYAKIANSAWVSNSNLYVDLPVEFNQGAIHLIDVTGREVVAFELSTGKQEFNLADLATGTYVLSIRLDGNEYNKKVVVQ